jgi:hypothetical protein
MLDKGWALMADLATRQIDSGRHAVPFATAVRADPERLELLEARALLAQ